MKGLQHAMPPRCCSTMIRRYLVIRQKQHLFAACSRRCYTQNGNCLSMDDPYRNVCSDFTFTTEHGNGWRNLGLYAVSSFPSQWFARNGDGHQCYFYIRSVFGGPFFYEMVYFSIPRWYLVMFALFSPRFCFPLLFFSGCIFITPWRSVYTGIKKQRFLIT